MGLGLGYRPLGAALLALALSVIPFALACGDDEDGIDREGLRMCCELGALCHPDADDPLASPKRACHDLGHLNEPDGCREQYESCVALCEGEPGEEPHSCD